VPPDVKADIAPAASIPRRELHTPRYLLRRSITLHVLSEYGPAKILEIGCGRGDLLLHLARRGWTGAGLEIAPEARAAAQERTRQVRESVSIVGDEQQLGRSLFDVVCATEVLEHIADDEAALRRWRDYVRPGGVLVLTVPAHMAKWTAADEFGGHQRRYERAELRALVERCDLRADHFWSYGFPLTELSWRIRHLTYRRRLASVEHLTDAQRTKQSSFDSTRRVFGESVLAPALDALVYPFHLLQLAFRSTDLGDGYVVVCRKA
jgi:SAM-dependent methyltransferase